MELDNKYIFRIVAVGTAIVLGVYWFMILRTDKVPEQNELLVSGAALGGNKYRPGGKMYPTDTDVYWCGAQNEDLGMSLSAARYWAENPESHFPLRRGHFYGG